MLPKPPKWNQLPPSLKRDYLWEGIFDAGIERDYQDTNNLGTQTWTYENIESLRYYFTTQIATQG